MNRIKIGIDTGTHTGIALYSCTEKKLLACETHGIIESMEMVKEKVYDPEYSVELYFEDARLRRWFGKSGREKLQGAGSVKRDASIWEEFCRFHNIKATPVAPKNNKTKLDASMFKRITGWSGRTSEHARDAAMLVI